MGDTEPSKETLHKTKHTSSSILLFNPYNSGLNPIETLNGPATCLARSNCITHHKKEPPMPLELKALNSHPMDG